MHMETLEAYKSEHASQEEPTSTPKNAKLPEDLDNKLAETMKQVIGDAINPGDPQSAAKGELDWTQLAKGVLETLRARLLDEFAQEQPPRKQQRQA